MEFGERTVRTEIFDVDEDEDDDDAEAWESESLYEDTLEGMGDQQLVDGG